MSPQSQFMSLIGWTFIPTTTTRFLQAIYYAGRYGSKSPSLPRQGSSRFARDFNIILITIIGLYLMSLVMESMRSMETNHYDTLGLKFSTFTQKQLKTNFRKASLQYHPDKVGQAGAEIFVGIRAAHETLVDPILRIAYDRFGPSVLKCTTCKTNKDYLREGFKQVSTFYAGAGMVLFLMNLVGKGTYGRYWRFILLAGMGALETSLILRSGGFLGGKGEAMWMGMQKWMPNMVTFEQIELLHQVYISLSVAFSQVGPLLFPSKAQSKQDTAAELMKRLQTLSDIAAVETMVQVKSWMDTLVGQDECITQLKRELGYMSLEMRLGQDSDFFATRTAIKARIERQGDGNNNNNNNNNNNAFSTSMDRKERLFDLD
ncbi:MAG: hypothetical protein J3R72DRAFT_442308 [Linnemannia gamsii]|nr:MAG: hypothetical protein J3R72DRAFT_442308 [Linnemannia gamsii]